MNKVKISSAFQQVFSAVLFLTLLSGSVSFWMAFQSNLSSQQNRIFENAMTTWQIGVGAIVGLLGGKATDLLHDNDSESEK